MNIIELNFIPTVTRITGNKYGYTTYNEQIKPKIKENEKNIIVFQIILKQLEFLLFKE